MEPGGGSTRPVPEPVIGGRLSRRQSVHTLTVHSPIGSETTHPPPRRPGVHRRVQPLYLADCDLDLSDDEVVALTRHLRQALDYDPYPLAPRLAPPLKAILAKLDPPPRPKRLRPASAAPAGRRRAKPRPLSAETLTERRDDERRPLTAPRRRPNGRAPTRSGFTLTANLRGATAAGSYSSPSNAAVARICVGAIFLPLFTPGD